VTIDDGQWVVAVIRDLSDRGPAYALAHQLAAIVASTDDAVIGETLSGQVTSWNPAVRDGAGNVIGASTIARDITLQQLLAEQVRASEELYRTTVEHAPIGIAVVALDGGWLSANRALCEMTGYTEQELRSRSFPDITQRKADRERLEAYAREQEALRSLATLVAGEVQPRVVLAVAAERTAEVFQADVAVVARLESTGHARVIGSWSAAHLPQVATGQIIDIDTPSAVAATLGTGRPARTGRHDDLMLDPAIIMESGLAAPIEVNGTLWGAVGVGWQSETAIDPHADERIRRIADLISLAVTGAEAREQLSRLASTDHLTGLSNQRAFSDRLDAEVARARRHGRPVSLIVLDLDHFKLVNDTHGHEVGNRALTEFADRLLTVGRSGELLARVGGEEFAWILPETTGADALAAAERARRAIADTPFPGVGRLTASAGVCSLDDAHDARELFRHADLALYWAKSHGRNTTVRCSPADLAAA
jgi:diguanylate cyclase (GGDEF)-like protein